MFSEARFGSSERLHLEFVELMHAENSFHVFSVSTGFFAEASGVTEITDRHVCFGENFVGMHRAEDMLGRSLKPKLIAFDFVAIF